MTRDGKRTNKGQVITVDKNHSIQEAIIKCPLAHVIVILLHCECSAIQYCWERSKVLIKMFCNFNFCDMVKLIPLSLL